MRIASWGYCKDTWTGFGTDFEAVVSSKLPRYFFVSLNDPLPRCGIEIHVPPPPPPPQRSAKIYTTAPTTAVRGGLLVSVALLFSYPSHTQKSRAVSSFGISRQIDREMQDRDPTTDCVFLRHGAKLLRMWARDTVRELISARACAYVFIINKS